VTTAAAAQGSSFFPEFVCVCVFVNYELYERRGPSPSRFFFYSWRCDAFIRVFDIYLFIYLTIHL